MKSKARSIRSWIVGGSVAFHAALAVAAVLIPKPERAETAAIELADIKKKKEPPKPPPPPPPPPQEKPKPPPPPPRAQAQDKAAPEATKAEAPPPMAMGEDGFADLGGLALGNGGGGGEGVAIPSAAGLRTSAAAAPKAVTKKAVQQLAAAGPNVCAQPVVRPKRTVGVQGKYTLQAKQAEIEGVVKVEVTVDESGKVIAARVLNGLGYGLDEAALEAAKKCVYEPATLCGRPVVATAVVAQRFVLE